MQKIIKQIIIKKKQKQKQNKTKKKLSPISSCTLPKILTLDVGCIFVFIVSVKLRANGRNNFQKCWELLANNVTSVCTGLKV